MGQTGRVGKGISNGRLPFDIPYCERKDSIATRLLGGDRVLSFPYQPTLTDRSHLVVILGVRDKLE